MADRLVHSVVTLEDEVCKYLLSMFWSSVQFLFTVLGYLYLGPFSDELLPQSLTFITGPTDAEAQFRQIHVFLGEARGQCYFIGMLVITMTDTLLHNLPPHLRRGSGTFIYSSWG